MISAIMIEKIELLGVLQSNISCFPSPYYVTPLDKYDSHVNITKGIIGYLGMKDMKAFIWHGVNL